MSKIIERIFTELSSVTFYIMIPLVFFFFRKMRWILGNSKMDRIDFTNRTSEDT